MVTLFPTWASPGYDNFAPHFGLNWYRLLWYPHLGLNLDLVTVVPTWVSPGPGVSRSHMTTPGLGDCGVPVDAHLPVDSGPH